MKTDVNDIQIQKLSKSIKQNFRCTTYFDISLLVYVSVSPVSLIFVCFCSDFRALVLLLYISMGRTLMQVTCPRGCAGGSFIQIRSPTGQLLQVTVPAGVISGQVFKVFVDVPAPQQITATATAAPVLPAPNQTQTLSYPYPTNPKQPKPKQQEYPPQVQQYQNLQPSGQTHKQNINSIPRVGYAATPKSPEIQGQQQAQQSSGIVLAQQVHQSQPIQQAQSSYGQNVAQPAAVKYVQQTQQSAQQQHQSHHLYSQAAAQSATVTGTAVQPHIQQAQIQAQPAYVQAQPQNAQVRARIVAQPVTDTSGAVAVANGPAPPQVTLSLPPHLSNPVLQLSLDVSVTNYLTPENERVYTFGILCAGVECWTFSGRFSELHKMEKQFKHPVSISFSVSCY